MINVGSADRVIRIVIGVVLITAPFVPLLGGSLAGLGALRYLVALAGAALVSTAALRFCPLYAIFGIRTRPLEKK